MIESNKPLQRLILVVLGLFVLGMPVQFVTGPSIEIEIEAEDFVEFEVAEAIAGSIRLTTRRCSHKRMAPNLVPANARPHSGMKTSPSLTTQMLPEHSARNGYGGPLTC